MPQYLIRNTAPDGAESYVSADQGWQIPNSRWRLTSSQSNAHRFTHDAALQAQSQLRQFGFKTTVQEITDANVLWIGGNIFFDLQTRESKQVLLFVYREEDAAAFTKQDAESYVAFVKERAARFGTFTWFIDNASRKPGFFVIRGHQSV